MLAWASTAGAGGAMAPWIFIHGTKGVGRKFSSGGRGNGIPKISKKYRKIALFSLFQGEGQRKKRPKNSKKCRKKALLSLYLLYLYHV